MQSLVAADLFFVRSSFQDNQLRVVLDVSSQVNFNVFQLQDPDRIVVDLFDTSALGDILPLGQNPIVRTLRYANRNSTDLRIVFTTNQAVDWTLFELDANRSQSHRIVLDLVSAVTTAIDARDMIVAIDAGHGGRDPGSIGPTGVREKDVVLDIAKKLSEELTSYEGIKVIMTREVDRYVSLRDRLQIASEANADLLVSLHADGFRDSRVSGATVYALSNEGATNEASLLLAARENGEVSLGDTLLSDLHFPGIANELINIYQQISIESGRLLGSYIADHLGTYTRVRKQDVQNASFVVLKAPDIASVLVETDFITNPREESLLASQQGQRDLARGTSNGILSYLIDNAPPNSYIAWNPPVLPIEPRRHTISWGETLSGIALRYQVSISRLRQANSFTGDSIFVGQVLTIPPG